MTPPPSPCQCLRWIRVKGRLSTTVSDIVDSRPKIPRIQMNHMKRSTHSGKTPSRKSNAVC